jgi:threonine/homoserine/homoserine lactone efflux protein
VTPTFSLDPGFFLRGLVIGFSIAAPVGPIGVLCIRRTLAEGKAVGFATGLGAAAADAVYGAIAGFGLTAISHALVSQQIWLRLIGGIFLLYLGAKTFASKPADQAAQARGGSLAAAFASTFVLTLTNPMTILSFVAVFAGFGLVGNAASVVSASVLVFGVFLGSALWWLLLSGGVGLFRERLAAPHLTWVNRLSGLVIAGFGLLALLGLK